MTYLNSSNGADAIQSLVEEVSTGLRAARDNGMIVRLPDFLDLEFVWLVEANAFESVQTDTEPALSTTQTATYPDVEETTVDNQASTGNRNDSNNSSRNGNSTNTPPRQDTETWKNGVATEETEYEYNDQ